MWLFRGPKHASYSECFLFSMLMSNLKRDAKELCEERAGHHERTLQEPCVDELLYADDTLLLSTSSSRLQDYMTCVGEIGNEYGLAFNWKIELLDVAHGGSIYTPEGEAITRKSSITYLGGLLSADGRVVSELGRRIGLAEQVFNELRKVCSHTSVTRTRKLEVFNACVLSKLMYGLHTAWLNKAERARLDSFQARCLRRIFKIPSSYISRTPNSTVRSLAGQRPLSHTLLQRQLLLYGHVANQLSTSPIRRSVLQSADVCPIKPQGPRKSGRPRHLWANRVYSHALKAADGLQHLRTIFANNESAKATWRNIVLKYIRVVEHDAI